MAREPETHHADELQVGMVAEFEREVTEQDVLDFARVSGDHNPLHVDAAYASGTNYGHRIVHGAFQVGLASAIVGMHLPGRYALLRLANAQFPQPLRFPARVRVRGEMIAWNRGTSAGRLRVTVQELPAGGVTADISIGFSLHGAAEHRPNSQVAVRPATDIKDCRLVLVTGASGGIGAHLVKVLLESYKVLATVNRSPLPENLTSNPNLHSVEMSFADATWPDALTNALSGEPLYAVIHCAWPGMPRGGLLQLPIDIIQSQLSYGTTHLVHLARILAEAAPSKTGRLIAISSVAGSLKPSLSLASYSLAKAAMEHTVRLLAAELAARRITVNAIAPTFVPVGLNKQADERRRKIEAAQIPQGRLCEPDDVSNLVLWLLSPQSSFVSGQILGLTGAQL